MSEYVYKGLAEMRKILTAKRTRVELRYSYYEMKKAIRDMSRVLPPGMAWLAGTLGWCSRTVDSVADRLEFRDFKNDNFDIMEIYQMNNPDVLFDSAILSALIGSCSFIYISPDEKGYPRMQVIDGSNATGVMDPITGMLKEGYAVLARDENRNPTMEAYFVPGRTDYVSKNGVEPYTNMAPYPLLVPIIYKPDAKRPFGHSRITRSCMDLQQSAMRTIKRSEIAAEFYSYPQKYALGVDPDLQIDKWQATMSSMLTLSADENGNIPKVGQFTQQSMTPYIEELRMFASLFAGETGLTTDDLGFVKDNPSSAEAIKASHENLRLAAKRAQKNFGSGFLNAGYLAACLRDEYAYERQQLYLTKPTWEPIFEPDAAMLSTIGDGILKVNQAIPGFFGPENVRDLTGIQGEMSQVVVIEQE